MSDPTEAPDLPDEAWVSIATDYLPAPLYHACQAMQVSKRLNSALRIERHWEKWFHDRFDPSCHYHPGHAGTHDAPTDGSTSASDSEMTWHQRYLNQQRLEHRFHSASCERHTILPATRDPAGGAQRMALSAAVVDVATHREMLVVARQCGKLQLLNAHHGVSLEATLVPGQAILGVTTHGCAVASAHAGGQVALWTPSRADGTTKTILGTHAQKCASVAFDPESGVLASTGAEGCVKIWDAAGSRALGMLTATTAPLCQAAWLSPAVLAVGAQDKKVRVLDARHPQASAVVQELAMDDWALSVARIDGDACLLRATDRSVKTFDLRAAAAGPCDVRHAGRRLVSRCAGSKRRLVSVSLDGTVRMSSVDSICHEPLELSGGVPGHAQVELHPRDYVLCCALDGDTKVVCGTAVGSVEVFDFLPQVRSPVSKPLRGRALSEFSLE